MITLSKIKKMNYLASLFIIATLVLSSCNTDDSRSTNENEIAISNDNNENTTPENEEETSDNSSDMNTENKARVVSVTTSGSENNYTFSVGISSPDTGCDQYADWWEVVTENGTLLYRRILAHSHVDEQPFIRSGGTVAINASDIVIIRAHMNTSGYGTDIYKGSINTGFTSDGVDDDFAQNLETVDPLPGGCAF